jgi:thiamine pyrophosphokinase
MRCVIIAGSPEKNFNTIAQAVSGCDLVICADKGYSYAKLLGIKPDLTVGDFDSYSGELPGENVVKLIPEKNDTDAAVCAQLAIEKGADDFVIVAATGGRFDHSYANLCLLEYLSEKGASACLLGEHERIELLKEGVYDLSQYEGKTFSLFPFGCSEATATVSGCDYPVTDFSFTSNSTTGLSNICGSECRAEVKSGKLLFVVNI